MICVCGHQPWSHSVVTYPAYRRPCDVCVNCGQTKRSCCLTPKQCSCAGLQAAVSLPIETPTEEQG